MSTPLESREITIRYFAWVREKIGRSEERLALPAALLTVNDVVAWMQARGPEYAAAFAKPDVVRAALDHKHVKPDTPIGNAREIGFFPPVTGG